MKKINKLSSLILTVTLIGNLFFPLSSTLAFDKSLPTEEAKKADEVIDGIEEQRYIVEFKKKSLLDEAINKNQFFKKTENLNTLNTLKREIKSFQDQKIKDWTAKKIIKDGTVNDITFYDTAINGIAFTGTQDDINRLKSDSDVKKVYLSTEFERPLLNSSTKEIGASYVGDSLGFKGEGMVVAVIDSGIDATHEAMRLDKQESAKLSSAKVEELIKKYNLKGTYISPKVPYGYNYYDHNQNLFNSYDSMHGMHVSGIVGANKPTSDSDDSLHPPLKGVAPNVQILGMKVFSDDRIYPTTFTDIWLKALDDAIKLGADAINMSLGAPAGIQNETKEHPEKEILKKAKEAGIIVSIAAGNDGNIVKGNTYGVKALHENYDTALIANPAVNEESLAVASYENKTQMENFLELQIRSKNRKETVKEAITLNMPKNAPDRINGLVGFFVDLGKFLPKETDNLYNLLNPANENQKQAGQELFNTKIVLIEFPTEKNDLLKVVENTEKILQYQPSAIIFYNQSDITKEKDRLLPLLPLTEKLEKTTIAHIKASTYKLINEYFITPLHGRSRFIIHKEKTQFANENSGTISTFSSWGPTPDLRIKPEITAPGSYIYSTVENNQYASMRGTSMAAPHVAGAAAIVKQYLLTKPEFALETKKPSEIADLIKLLLMNTAKPVLTKNNHLPYFVRQQGSGLIQLKEALKTPVTVQATGTNDKTEDGKLELRQIDQTEFALNLKLTNYQEKKIKYRISYQIFTEKITPDGFRSEEQELLSSPDAENLLGEVEVDARQENTFHSNISFANIPQEIINNNFIEGFITLEPITESGEEIIPTLSVPLLAFYGNWQAQKAIDAFSLPEYNSQARNIQFYVNKTPKMTSSRFITAQKIPIPINKNTLYISPKSLYHNKIYARIAPLRNMELLTYSIADAETKEDMVVLGYSQEVRKLSRLARDNSFRIMPTSGWDGKIDGIDAPEDKTYLYRLTAKLNSNLSNTLESENTTQIFEYPLKIDNKAPELSNLQLSQLENNSSLDRNNYKLVSFKVSDTGVGLSDIYLQSVRYAKINEGFDPSLLPPPGKEPEIDTKPIIENPPIINPTNNLPENSSNTNDSSNNGSSNAILKAQYGKSLHLNLVDEPIMDGKVLPKIVNNELSFSLDDMLNIYNQQADIYVYKNGYTNEELTVNIPYEVDRTHLLVSVKDALSHKTSQEIKTGLSYNMIDILFLNLKTNLFDKGGILKINEQEHQSPFYRAKETNEPTKIELIFPNNQRHINTLQIKRGKNIVHLIENSSFLNSTREEYQVSFDEKSGSLSFILPELTKNTEIIFNSAAGSFNLIDLNQTYNLSLTNIKAEKFRKISLDNKNIEYQEQLNLPSGSHWFEFVYKKELEPAQKTVRGVLLLHKDKEPTSLPRLPQFDLESKVGFSQSPYSLKIHLKLNASTEIKLIYEEDGDFTDLNSFLANYSNHNTILKGIVLEDINLNDNSSIFSDEDEHGQPDDSDLEEAETYPYPSIFLTSPHLLKIVTKNDLAFSDEAGETGEDALTGENSSAIRVTGFIGNIDRADEIEKVMISIVDDNGDILPNFQPISLASTNLTKKATHFGSNQASAYHGQAYHFDVNVPVSTFNVNLKVETFTKNKKYGGMIRRIFYDKEYPLISSEISPRSLDSKEAIVKLIVRDDSFRMDLFQNNSLIDFIDTSPRTFKTNGTTIEKTVTVKLKSGQNRFDFRVSDLAGQNTNQTIYIYKVS